jgi:hypothetical protein
VHIEATTPSSGEGGIRVYRNTSNVASISIVSSSGAELNSIRYTANGEFAFSAGAHPNVEIGYKTIPQIGLNPSGLPVSINSANSSGAHYYKQDEGGAAVIFPNSTNASCPIGTAITFVNDSSGGGAITLDSEPGGSVILQLGGTTSITGMRTIVPGGIGTALKVKSDKWIVYGTGVL